MAFDTGPGNVFLDFYTSKITNKKQSFDKNGEISKKGKINEKFLEKLKQFEYFSMKPPKTTGRELFNVTVRDIY